MDATRFDELTRKLAAPLPRRRALRLAGITSLGWWSGSHAPGADARVCHIVGERCGKGIKGTCCPGTTCRRRKTGRGTCVCRPGLTSCNGYCFDIANDPQGCGPNCRTCPPDTDCCNGSCCPAGQRCCGGICTDLTADDQNCGGCTQVCPDGLTCCDSRCRVLAADPRHCGKCGHACGRGYLCQQGQCVCPAGWQDCGDGVCRNVQVDNDHCGQCGNACSRFNRCEQGQCVCGRDGVTCVKPHDPSTVCGLPDNSRCTESTDCCSDVCLYISPTDPGGNCLPCLGRGCQRRPCCGGYSCETRARDGQQFCGGCAPVGSDCLGDSECCVTTCTVEGERDGVPYRTCASLAGGPCGQPIDCRACYQGRRCVDVCVDGRCRI